jgi:DNA helicase HerA-like ATPase
VTSSSAVGHLPADEATKHFLAVGTTGSGKTIVLRLLMQSALPDIGTRK